jgi:CRP-like cAMP-binding protein
MSEASAGSPVPLIEWLLPDVRPDARLALAAIARDEHPTAGTYLMRAGRPTLELGIIAEGRLAVRDTIGVDDVTLMTLEPGDVFGWSAVLDGISTASIVALEGARVLLFERTELLQAMDADQTLAVALYRRLLEAVAMRLDATRLLMRDVYGGGVAT